MKKSFSLTALLLMLALVFSGCGKKKTEWNYLYDYSVDDIAGTYHFSNVENAFELIVESNDVRICEDAILTVTKLSETTVRIHLKCPDENYDQTFEGQPFDFTGDYRVYLKKGDDLHPTYEINASVYTNKQGEIRLHGYGRKSKYHPEDGWYFQNWYFDVIKN